MTCNRPHIGVAIIISDFKERFLLMKRKGAHGEGTWCFPGGKLDKFESIEDCAIRETKEETNLDIFNIKIDRFTNDMFIRENLHYITIFVYANTKSYDARIMEGNKCTEIGWFEWNNFPDNLFLPIINYRNG